MRLAAQQRALALTGPKLDQHLAEIDNPAEAAQLARDFSGLAEVARRTLKDRHATNKALLGYAKAARRTGKLLSAVPRSKGGRPPKNSYDHRTSLQEAVAACDLKNDTVKRWLQLSRVATAAFDEWVAQVEADEVEPALWIVLGSARLQTPNIKSTPIAPPVGTYRTLVIDPPWPVKKIEREERPVQGYELDYRTLTLEQLADEEWLPVRTALALDGTHVYLWVTQRFLPAGLDLFEQWGVRYQCVMTWVKNVGPTPFSWMYDTEHVLFGTVGSLPLQQLGLRLSFSAPTHGHSVKPDVFYERVISASPEPRLEMFARTQRAGFIAWGNEAPDV